MTDVAASLTAQQAVGQALQALHRKDRRAARRLAEQAVALDEKLEDAWLVLAAVASPQASLFYLRRALQINPSSERARRGMHWAAQRLRRRATQSGLNAPFHRGLDLPLPALGDTQPVLLRHAQTRPLRVWGGVAAQRQPALMWLAAALFLVVAFMIAVAFNNQWVVLARSASAELPAGLFFKPSLTPTHTPTSTPTYIPTPTPTDTPTPTPTHTPTPTSTHTPDPTETPVPPTEVPERGEVPAVSDGRWIDVDLSEQMVYAYEGDRLVNSFLVSTGTWQHPTVTGQFRIYVKYRYTDMSGPGYYLRDVPYTMYFYKGYGLHGTYWHSNFGTPMSHGCVNLRTEDAAWLFDWASVGTPVNVHE